MHLSFKHYETSCIKQMLILLFFLFAVKPDPPEIIEVNTIPKSPSRLEVKWRNPQSWPEPDTMPLKYFLRYKPVILNDWQHVSVSYFSYTLLTTKYNIITPLDHSS